MADKDMPQEAEALAVAADAAQEEPKPVAPKEEELHGPLNAPKTAKGQVRIALLDGTGTLTGYDVVDSWEEGDLGLPVPEATDLKPLGYRYDVLRKTFDPIRKADDDDKIAAAPNTLYAIAAFMKAAHESGVLGEAFPQITIDWVAWFRTTIDGRGL